MFISYSLWVIKTYLGHSHIIDLPELSMNHEQLPMSSDMVCCVRSCSSWSAWHPRIGYLWIGWTCLNMLHHMDCVCLCNMLLHLSMHMYSLYSKLFQDIRTYYNGCNAFNLCHLYSVFLVRGKFFMLHWSPGLHWWMGTTSCSPIEIPSASGH